MVYADLLARPTWFRFTRGLSVTLNLLRGRLPLVVFVGRQCLRPDGAGFQAGAAVLEQGIQIVFRLVGIGLRCWHRRNVLCKAPAARRIRGTSWPFQVQN